uniref:Lipid-binding serum glycoprotein N-terminal domain-containing protein n=1 Tax=Glossina brevipalpis TaxID=37001 RepID=A0A1A9W1Q9_9MUSC
MIARCSLFSIYTAVAILLRKDCITTCGNDFTFYIRHYISIINQTLSDTEEQISPKTLLSENINLTRLCLMGFLKSSLSHEDIEFHAIQVEITQDSFQVDNSVKAFINCSTSAPISARIIVQYGPATIRVKSNILIPQRGCKSVKLDALVSVANALVLNLNNANDDFAYNRRPVFAIHGLVITNKEDANGISLNPLTESKY